MKCNGINCPITSFCKHFEVDGDPAPIVIDQGLFNCSEFSCNNVHAEQRRPLGNQIIESLENLGDQAGGSGHLSHVTYKLLACEEIFLNEIKSYFLLYELYIQSEFNDYSYMKAYSLIWKNDEVLRKNEVLNHNTSYPDDLGFELPTELE
jgi:hypothetical protein